MDPLILHTEGDGVLVTPAAEVAVIAEKIVAANHAVIHIHGGLVSENSAMQMAARLHPYYGKDDQLLPVFPVWESGWLEAAWNNLHEIPQEALFAFVLKTVLKHAGGKILQAPGGRASGTYQPLTDLEARAAIELAGDSAGGTGEIPLLRVRPGAGLTDLTPDEKQQLAAELEKSAELQIAVDEVLLGMGIPEPAGRRALSPNVSGKPSRLAPVIKEELRATAQPGTRGLFSVAGVALHIVKIVYQVVKRFVQGRDHGFYTTVVEEIMREFYVADVGGWLWGRMKMDCADTFQPGLPGKPRGGRLLCDELSPRLLKQATTGPLNKLSVVAHSAGAIWACHFLSRLAALRTAGLLPADFQLHRIIFLAPACRMDEFAPILKLHAAQPLWRKLHVFGLSDPLEGAYWEIPVLYPKSLLYIVSGVAEKDADTPLVGMERFHRNAATYNDDATNQVRAYCAAQAQPVWALATGGPGLNNDTIKHGAFDDTEPAPRKTMESVAHLLAT